MRLVGGRVNILTKSIDIEEISYLTKVVDICIHVNTCIDILHVKGNNHIFFTMGVSSMHPHCSCISH